MDNKEVDNKEVDEEVDNKLSGSSNNKVSDMDEDVNIGDITTLIK